MKERDVAKQAAILSEFKSDWQIYCKLKNVVTKLNKIKINCITVRKLQKQNMIVNNYGIH